MDRKRLREEAYEALMSGESYQETLKTQVVMAALDDAPEIHLTVPIRFRKRYEEMSGTDQDS